MKRRNLLAMAGGATAALLLPGGGSAHSSEELSGTQRRSLAGYGADIWRSLEAMVDPDSGLAVDNIDADLSDGSRSGYTSPTNIGCYLWSAIAARELGLLSAGQARRRTRKALESLATLERHPFSGMFYNWYDPASGEVLHTWPDDGTAIHPFLSSVDNAWLATALTVVANDDPALRRQALRLLGDMDFAFYYDVNARGADFGAGLFRGGFWPEEPPGGGVKDNYSGNGPDVWYTGHHYGTQNSETRMIGYVAIARNQVPAAHYFAPWRTYDDSCDWSWQEMKPVGSHRTYRGIEVFEGAYRYRGLQVVPSWGGAMFEALMPDLFVPEARWGSRSWAHNHRAFVKGQIAHGMNEAGYGHWGFSPASDPFGGYREYGVDPLGLDSAGYTSDRERTSVDYGFDGCGRDPLPEPARYGDGVVTPHAVFLAVPYAPRQAMDQLARLRREFDVYGPGGFCDAVAVRSGTVARRHLALDQGMIMASIANLLCDNVIRRGFSNRATEAVLRPLLAEEEFNVPADQ